MVSFFDYIVGSLLNWHLHSTILNSTDNLASNEEPGEPEMDGCGIRFVLCSLSIFLLQCKFFIFPGSLAAMLALVLYRTS